MEKAISYLRPHLNNFNSQFGQLFNHHNFLLKSILKYIIKSKGKQIRPLTVLLASEISGGINERTYRAACLIELLHTATLVHDDVVDDAAVRRNQFSINAIWKNKIAVLSGDFLLSRGLLLALEHNDFELLKISANAVKEMSEGELLQIEKARRLDITEDVYYDIIKAKTASLLAASCSSGAYSANEDFISAEKFKTIGTNLGIAFQIKDDLLDFEQHDTGKNAFADFKEQKLTLPIIHALQQGTDSEVRNIKSLIKKSKKSNVHIETIMTFIKKYKGIEYAHEQMKHYEEKAIHGLRQFPESEARLAFEELIDFSITRKS